MKKPSGVYLAILINFFLLGFYAYGSYLIFRNSKGDDAGLELSQLRDITTLKTYTPIGVLLVIFGVALPLFTNLCLISRPPFKWPKKMNIYSNYQWPYAFALYTSYTFIFIAASNILLREGTSIFPALTVIASGVLIIILNNPKTQTYFVRRSKKTKSTSGVFK